MEKVKLNNQVVIMRKYVKQAKVHIINKLVKEVKLLQNRKGNEIQVQKAKRKAERFLEEISLIKKIRPDDVSKLALSKSKNWKDVLLQKNSSLNDRCFAMLATYEAVEKEVEQFYKCNQQLASKISDYLKQWEDKNKHSIKSPKVNNALNRREKNNKNVPKANVGDNKKQLTKKSKLGIETNGQPANEIEKSSIADDSEMKNESRVQTISKENKIPITAKSNDGEPCVPSDDDDDDEDHSIIQNNIAMKKSFGKSPNAEILNSTNTDNSDNDSDDASGSDQSEINGHLKKKIEAKKLNDISDHQKDTEENSDNDENGMEIENTVNSEDSEGSDSESETGVAESTNINKFDTEKQDSNILEYIKKMNNSEKKAITLLKLDELDGLEEIPINAIDKDESSELKEESSEEEMNVPHGKRNDPFFLGCGDDSTDENVEGSKNDKFGPKTTFVSNDGPQSRNSTFFKKRDNSNYLSGERQSEKFFPSNKFSKRDSLRHNFKSRDNHNKFQSKYENKFGNQRDFKAKNKNSFSHGKRSFENKSNDLYKRDNKEKSFKPRGMTKEGNTNDKALHPSWEAKRKQKEIANTFQGKRIVFDD